MYMFILYYLYVLNHRVLLLYTFLQKPPQTPDSLMLMILTPMQNPYLIQHYRHAIKNRYADELF